MFIDLAQNCAVPAKHAQIFFLIQPSRISVQHKKSYIKKKLASQHIPYLSQRNLDK